MAGYDNHNHPSDAFELGKAAAARLAVQDEELSYTLPQALETLFDDSEFKEAMGVSGVINHGIQTLTPVASYQMASSSRSSSFSPTKRFTRGREMGVTSPQGHRHSPRSRRQQPRHVLPLQSSSTTPSKRQVSIMERNRAMDKDDHSDYEEMLDEQLNADEDMDTAARIVEIDREECLEVKGGSLNNTTNDDARLNRIEGQKLQEYKCTTEVTSSEDTEITEEQEEDSTLVCVCCKKPCVNEKDSNCTEGLASGNPLSPETKRILRELFWKSLGMTKIYDRKASSFPFCDKCIANLQKLYSICKQIGTLEDEFNEIRLSLCKEVVSKHISMTKAANKKVPFTSQQKSFLENKIVNKMKEEYILKAPPGKRILDEINEICGNEETTKATSENSTPKEPMFECRVCDKKFQSLRTRKNHEKVHTSTQETFKCKDCNKNYSSKGGLETHIKGVHEQGGLACNYCDKTFTVRGNLIEHVYRHVNFKKLQCTICSERYHIMKHMNNHFRKRHPTSDTEKFVKKCTPPPDLKFSKD